MMSLHATCLGYPRIGASRELKRAVEQFWAKEISASDLDESASKLRARHWRAMADAGMDTVPTNDFSLYDQVLDAAVMLGAVPARYRRLNSPLGRYFAMARGFQDRDTGVDVAPMEMTKWFDTNYHYIVPELEPNQRFQLDATAIVRDVEEARACGVAPRPVVLGGKGRHPLSDTMGGAGLDRCWSDPVLEVALCGPQPCHHAA